MIPRNLSELEDDVARDLGLVAYPADPWVPARTIGGEAVLDVLIVGAGQGGLSVAAGLMRERITNIQVVDARPQGQEGIWTDFARMHTLRTPKFIGGPDLGLPSLTFQAWFDAQHGPQAFQRIKYIAKEDWQAYLTWYRRVLAIPVRNEVTFRRVAPRDGVLCVNLSVGGTETEVYTRKVVLAGGIETSGTWWMPDCLRALPHAFRAHAADPIDFPRLRGKRVAVIGAAASAFDNAATALESGAAEVRLFCRRPTIQRVQPYKVLAYAGFLRHFGSLDDDARWRLMNYVLTIREALTRETWERATRHAGFDLVTGAAIEGAVAHNDGVRLSTSRGDFEADFVIAGTGFDIDLNARPELAGVADQIATWADRYRPPDDEANPRLGRYPYLNEGMGFVEKTPGTAPWISDIHCFNFGATMSFGPSGSSISAMKFAVPRVVQAIGRDLFRADIAVHEARLRAYDTPEFPLDFARDQAKAS